MNSDIKIRKVNQTDATKWFKFVNKVWRSAYKSIFPEEVFLHEFLHTLERNSKEYGYEVPALHDYEKYNYSDDRYDGLRKWYIAYMNGMIKTNSRVYWTTSRNILYETSKIN